MSLSNKGLPQSFKLLARSISLKVSSVDKVSSSIGTEDEGLLVHALKKNSAQNNKTIFLFIRIILNKNS
jgi:hypothetical protein